MECVGIQGLAHKRRRRIGFAVAASFAVLMSCRAVAQDAPATASNEGEKSAAISWGYESDCNPRYVWRGLAFSQGAVLQTSAWMTAKGTTYAVWTNRNLETVDGRRVNEIDHSLSWEGSWHKAKLEPMLQVWTYPGQIDSPSTAEADLKLSWPVGGLELFTSHGIDVYQYRGAYFGDLGLSLQKETSKHSEIESCVSLGWGSSKFNETYIGPGKNALNLAAFEVRYTYTNRSGTYFCPHLSVSSILDRELRRAVSDPSLVIFGMSIGREF